MNLESRLAKLERVVRWQRFVLVAVLAIGGAVVMMGAAPGKVVSVDTLHAKRILIEDADGVAVASFGFDEDSSEAKLILNGDPKNPDNGIVLTSGKKWQAIYAGFGKQSVHAMATPAKATLDVKAPIGTVTMEAFNVAAIGIKDKSEKVRATMGANAKGESAVIVYGTDNKIEWSAP